MATKRAIIDFLNRLLQKVINRRFSWNSNFSSPNSTVHYNFVNKSKNWHLVLHKLIKYVNMATKRAIIDFLNRLLQKVINRRFSWNSSFSSPNSTVHYNFVNKSKYWHLVLHKLIKYVNTATKRAIINFLNRLLQKVINRRFSRNSSFSSPNSTVHYNFVNKSKYWHLVLHKLIKYVNTATKRAIIDFLNRLLQKVINRRFSWNSNFSSPNSAVHYNFVNKSKYWLLLLHKLIKYVNKATKWAIIDFLNRLVQKVINRRFSRNSNFSSPNSTVHYNFVNKSKYWHLVLHKLIKYVNTATKRATIDFLNRLVQKVINRRFSWNSTFSSPNSTVHYNFVNKSKYWLLVLQKLIKYVNTATKWAVIDFVTRLFSENY